MTTDELRPDPGMNQAGQVLPGSRITSSQPHSQNDETAQPALASLMNVLRSGRPVTVGTIPQQNFDDARAREQTSAALSWVSSSPGENPNR